MQQQQQVMPLDMALSLAIPGVVETVPEFLREQILTEAILTITIQATARLAQVFALTLAA